MNDPATLADVSDDALAAELERRRKDRNDRAALSAAASRPVVRRRLTTEEIEAAALAELEIRLRRGPKSTLECAQLVGLSRERCRQIEARALLKLRKRLGGQGMAFDDLQDLTADEMAKNHV